VEESTDYRFLRLGQNTTIKVDSSQNANIVRFFYRTAIYSSTDNIGKDALWLSTATRGRQIFPIKQLVGPGATHVIQTIQTYLVAWY
jgi:hypothetical protein